MFPTGDGDRSPENFESFDTETLNRKGGGYAVLLVKSDGSYLEFPGSFDDCFSFLCGGKYTCFNMDFDARAIFHEKFLPWDKLERLALYGSEKFCSSSGRKYSTRYVPRKFLRVSCEAGQSFELFDIQQFFGMSLREAVKTYLPAQFQKDDIPKSWYNEIDKCLKDSRRGRIIEYALKDAQITKKLTTLLTSSFQKAGLKDCSRLISPASLAKQYFGPRLKNAVKIPKRENLAFRPSLFGGRVEALKLGKIKRVKLYDIHSAYPAVMRGLPSLRGAYYRRREKPKGYDRKALYGSYHVSVEMPRKMPYGPLAVNSGGMVEYPGGKFNTTCGNNGLAFLDRWNISFRINKSHEYIGNKSDYPFLDLSEMYLQRKIPVLGLALKLIMNSGFGILCECQQVFTEEFTHAHARDINGNPIKSSEILGEFNCFPMAAAITEMVRMKIWEVMMQYPGKVYMAATDSVLVDESVSLPTGPGLGEWGLKGEYDEAVILGCGRYILYRGGVAVEKHLRGFDVSEESFRRLENCQSRRIRLPLFGAGSLRQWAIGGCLDELNVLQNSWREFKIEDTKRKWAGEFNRISDAWKYSIDSEPWIAV